MNGATRPPQCETVTQADAAGLHSGCTNPHATGGALGSQASRLCQPSGADVRPAMPSHQGCLPESSPSVSGTFFLLTCRRSLYIYTQGRAHCHVLSLTSSLSPCSFSCRHHFPPLTKPEAAILLLVQRGCWPSTRTPSPAMPPELPHCLAGVADPN